MRDFSIAAIALAAVLACAAQNKTAPLSIQNVEIAQYEDGPLVPSGSYFVPGETVFLSFQVAGYRPAGEDEQSVKLNWQIEATNPPAPPSSRLNPAKSKPPSRKRIRTGIRKSVKPFRCPYSHRPAVTTSA